jgi:ubiquinone/menaquinone biosynthesis C-methylase UbiE
MSAEKMSFKNNSFDYVVGLGALHHLNIELASKEIYRVLKNGGKAIFLEPRIPFKWIMVLRSVIPVPCNESPGGGSLDDNELYKFVRHFTDSEIHYFLFLRKIFRIPILRRFELKADRIDSFIINKFPFSRKLCWAFVLEFTK